MRDWARAAGCPLQYDERYPFAKAHGYDGGFCEDPDLIKLEGVAPSVR